MLLMQASVGEKSFWNLMRSAVAWSALVERMRFPWLLKLAATTFKCFKACFDARTELMFMMTLGSGLRLVWMPFSRKFTTSLEG